MRIKNCTTSYETEAIAIATGLQGAEESFEPRHQDIHILTDTLSCLTKLESIATKPQPIPAFLAHVAKQIHRTTVAKTITKSTCTTFQHMKEMR